ncbi:MAG: serine/threonine protein kinase [Acidobacteria bacterium]|nr:serine/threonine protein kinase [Acidobacteriota bacterium]
MALSSGIRLGPYEVLTPLGAGGMGEVYRAKDTRLGREVAVKVLPAAYSQDADRLRRFEQEARAASALNHPNILTIHDIGTHEGSPYLVSELLEGETLREHLGGVALPQRKAIDYAIQVANGLAAAHEKGIVHRDLKPENLFLTKDGRVKILDFGLAKLTQPEQPSEAPASAATLPAETETGVVLGTMGYMSPEQVRGQRADHRADIFTFGAILYEMLTGKRAFRGESAVETMNAILKEEPLETQAGMPVPLEHIVRHCLEKTPEQRFQSARDLAFDLEALSTLSTTLAPATLKQPPRRWLRPLAGLALLAIIAGVFFIGRRTATSAVPSFQRLTFRRGTVRSGRFAPEGRTIVYSASWEGKPAELFSARPDSPESRSLGFEQADVQAISSAGEMALLLKPQSLFGWSGYKGTLARAPLAGGAPREVLADAQTADWAPDGAALAVVRAVGERNRVEFPIGKVLYETADNILAMRISPRGDLVALAEHPPGFGTKGSVSVLDLKGNKRLVGVFAKDRRFAGGAARRRRSGRTFPGWEVGVGSAPHLASSIGPVAHRAWRAD